MPPDAVISQGIDWERLSFFLALLCAIVASLIFLLRWYYQSHSPPSETDWPRLRGLLTALGVPPTPRPVDPVRVYCVSLCDFLNGHMSQIGLNRLREDYMPRTFEDTRGRQSFDDDELLEHVQAGNNVYLRGSAGIGKTTTLHRLAIEFSILAIQPSAPVPHPIPVYISCLLFRRSLLTQLGEQERSDVVVRRHIQSLLWSEAQKPFGPTGNRSDLLLQLDERRIILFIDGLDELWPLPKGENQAETELLKLFLEELRDFQDSILSARVSFLLASRASAQDMVLSELGNLQVLEVKPPSAKSAGRFIRSHHPELEASADLVIKLFEQRLGSRPLYLPILCRHWKRLTGGGTGPLEALMAPRISRAVLLELEAMTQIEANVKDGKYHADPKGIHQRLCLQRLAVSVADGQKMDDPLLRLVASERIEATDSSATTAEGKGKESERAAQLQAALCRFLRAPVAPTGDEYSFFHPDFRDYWLADSVREVIDPSRTPDIPSRRDSLKLVFLSERVPEILLEIFAQYEPAARAAIRERFRKAIETSDEIRPATRREATDAAAALTLLNGMLDDAPEFLRTVNGSGKIFQGLKGAGMRLEGMNFENACFRGCNMQGASFRNSRLVGADLDNVDLHGADLRGCDLTKANLKNAGMGCLTPPGKPTDFREAILSESNWFNIRVSLRGNVRYIQGMIMPGDDEIVISSSRGNLRSSPLTTTNALAWTNLTTGHEGDVVDFDIASLPGGKWRVATASTDKTVRIGLWERGAPIIAPTAILKTGHQPPRRVAFSRSHRWLAIGDRNSNLRFHPVDRLEEISRGDGSEARLYTDHSGPVMCLIPGSAGETDMFYSAGYDGRIIRWREPGEGSDTWSSRELLYMENEATGEPDTIRVLALWPSKSSTSALGLFVGGESQVLRYYRLHGVDHLEFKYKLPVEAPIFSIDLVPVPNGTRIALGLANGRVHIYDVPDSPPFALQPVDSFDMGDEDIVRFVAMLEGGHDVLAATWNGIVRRWSCQNRQTVLTDAVPESDWRPEDDHTVLRFGSPNEIDRVVGLSHRYKSYLARLS